VQTPVVDPVLALIAASDGNFKAGERELELGHAEAARLDFDRAVDILLESPYGARTEPRIREHFDRLIDRISAYEVKALSEGDGFTEKRTSRRRLANLALSATFGRPAPAPEPRAVQTDLETRSTSLRSTISASSPISSCSGPLHDFIEEGMRAAPLLPMIQACSERRACR
jgi:membrane-bound lytic murein transglycosylase D